MDPLRDLYDIVSLPPAKSYQMAKKSKKPTYAKRMVHYLKKMLKN